MENPNSLFDIYVPASGNREAKIVFINESPTDEEVRSLTPGIGSDGRFFDQLLLEAGIDKSNIWQTHVVKYFVPPQPKDKKIPFRQRASSVNIDVDRCVEELRTELSQLNPNVIVPLGSTALWATCGKLKIQDWRGSILGAMNGKKSIATYRPGDILHNSGEIIGYWNKPIMLHDLRRARDQSQFPDFRLPKRNLRIVTDVGALHDFFERHRGFTSISIDIEADGCIPICIGLAFTRYEGIAMPLWNTRDFSHLPSSTIASFWCIIADRLNNLDAIGQNFGYDRDKIRRLGFKVRGLANDNMIKAFAIQPELPKNQAFLTSIYTEEPFYKNETMYQSSLSALLIGCARDAAVAVEISEKMEPELDELHVRDFYNKFLLPLHDLYHFREDNTSIEQFGVRVDEDLRKKMIVKYLEWDEKVRYELFQIAGEEINTSSPKQVEEFLYDKLRLPRRSGTGEEVLTGLLNSSAVRNPIHKKAIELILEDRRVKKTLSSYLYSPPDFDGRMRTSCYICLETGRSATQQQEPPIRPVVEYRDEKKAKKYAARGMAFQVITKHGDIGADVGTMLCSDLPDEHNPDGYVFLQADSAQAEARVIFLLAEDYEALKLIDTTDYHALTASWFFGEDEYAWSKKKWGYEHPVRFIGKTLRHAGHLGASKRRAMLSVNTDARKYKIDTKIDEAFADKALKIFHAKQPNIKRVFQAGIIDCLQHNKRQLRAPVPYGIDAEYGGVRTFFERWGDELFRQAFSYIPQRTVSENTKAAGMRVRARAPWIIIVRESHDALLCQVPINRKQEAAKILREELERPINFRTCSLSRGELVIPCEIEEGFNFKDMSKFKWLVESELITNG